MKLKKVILELEQDIQPYIPFLNEWSQNEVCSLTKEDINLINIHLKNDFKISPLLYFNSSNSIKSIQRIVAKLIWDFQKFKDWVITNFVFSLLKLIKDNSFNIFFLHLPLEYLSLPYDLKNKLKLFNIKTVYEIFENYKEEDLYKEHVFNNILQFEISFKKIINP